MFNHTIIGPSRFVPLAIAALVLGCASGPQIVANSAPDFNLADYRTFNFLQPLSSDRGEVRSLMSTHLIEATTRELELAGLQKAAGKADLLVNFVVFLSKNSQFSSNKWHILAKFGMFHLKEKILNEKKK